MHYVDATSSRLDPSTIELEPNMPRPTAAVLYACLILGHGITSLAAPFSVPFGGTHSVNPFGDTPSSSPIENLFIGAFGGAPILSPIERLGPYVSF